MAQKNLHEYNQYKTQEIFYRVTHPKDAEFFSSDQAAFSFAKRGVLMVRKQANEKTTTSDGKKASPSYWMINIRG